MGEWREWRDLDDALWLEVAVHVRMYIRVVSYCAKVSVVVVVVVYTAYTWVTLLIEALRSACRLKP